jgi:hypothetical protein
MRRVTKFPPKCCVLGGGALRSHHGTSIDFDKICVFYGKCYVHIDKCVFIVVKIKCVNSGKIRDKVNFTTNYTQLQHLTYILLKYTQYFIKTHTYYNF